MRSILFCAALVVVLGASPSAFAQQPDQPQQPPVNEDKVKEPAAAASATPAPSPIPASQISSQAAGGESVAAAARRAREQKNAQAQAKPREFDNDNIPKQGGVSAVGQWIDSWNFISDGTADNA